MANQLKDIKGKIKAAIEKEQQPENREKTLTPGLMASLEIINQYQANNNHKYEYEVTTGNWIDAPDKETIKRLEALGFSIRRKKHQDNET